MRIIAGTCTHEGIDTSLQVASVCSEVCKEFGIDYYFKASFDKANRTSHRSKRGTGLFHTMDDFREMKKFIPNLKFLTDVHGRTNIFYLEENYQDVIDVIQIPAFLCRQTDLLERAAASPFTVNVKKGQFLAPWDVNNIFDKLDHVSMGSSNREFWITERGTSFGYNTLVVDFTGVNWMLQNSKFDAIVFDATHSVQSPGGNGTSSGGNRDDARALLRAASALGVQNFFMEVHPDPDNSWSDGPNSLKLKDFRDIVEEIVNANYSA